MNYEGKKGKKIKKFNFTARNPVACTIADELMDAIRMDPTNESTRWVLADCLEEQGEILRPSILRGGKIPLEPLEWRLIMGLAACPMPPATWERSFIHDLASRIGGHTSIFLNPLRIDRLSPRQLLYLWKIAREHRNRLPGELAERINDLMDKRSPRA